jgi:nucleoid-associated protein YgaU
MRQRWILIGVVILVALAVVRTIIAPPGGGGDVAVDTTGATGGGATPVRTTPVPTSGRSATATGSTPVASAAPNGVPTASGPTPTTVVVQVQGTSVAIERKPLVLLNPSSVRQGSSLGVTGSGFDPGATIDVYVKQQESDNPDPITFVQVDKSGGFGGVAFAVPETLPRGSFIVEARERESNNVARATAVVSGGSPQVKLGTGAGKSGDTVELSAQGFGPDEDVNVYWNGLTGDSVGTLHTDGGGAVRQGSIRVPFGAVGNNGFVFIGDNSQSPVTVPFQLLNLYPSVALSSYAIKADNVLSFTGKDFGPDEQVMVYLNSPDGPPLEVLQADGSGGFDNAGGFLVPFGLHGKQTLIYVGEQSNAPTTASFDTLPYTPSAQPSTYGGRPGTTLTFYAIGFARDEIVHALVGRTQDNPGQEVSCFRTDAQGNAASGGSYIVPADAAAGQLIFSLLGSKSESVATAALEVIASDVPVQVPPQPPFQCNLTDPPPSDTPQLVDVSTDTSVVDQQSPAPSPNAGPSPQASRAQPSPTAVRVSRPTSVAPASPTARAAVATPTVAAQATAAPTPSRATPAANPAVAGATSSPSKTYTVKAGDTLGSIAQQVYGDANQWRGIFDANQAALNNNSDVIKPGTKLTLPAKGS